MFYIHENRAKTMGIKIGKPLETLAVFGLQSFRPHVLVGDGGFDLHFLLQKRKKMKVRLGLALAGGAHPRRI